MAVSEDGEIIQSVKQAPEGVEVELVRDVGTFNCKVLKWGDTAVLVERESDRPDISLGQYVIPLSSILFIRIKATGTKVDITFPEKWVR